MGILSLIEPAFKARPSGGTPTVGDLYWVPTGYAKDPQTILEVERSSPQEHEELSFSMQQIGSTHFRGEREERRLPIKQLALQGREELLVTKAKRRPCIVVADSVVDDVATISDASQQRLAQKSVGKRLYLVAPCFSVSTMREPGTFGPELVARVRALQYPHLFCLPEQSHADRPGSIVRLDHLFPSYLGRGCAPLPYRLSEDAYEVLLSAVSIVVGSGDPKHYYDLQQLINETGLPQQLSP